MGCTKSSVEQASNEFNALPPAVQHTVRTRVPDAEIADVSKHTRDGTVAYEIKFRDSKRHPAMEVAENGNLLKFEAGTAMGIPPVEEGTIKGSGQQSPYSALPVGVQKAIQTYAPRADVSNVRRTEKNGQVVYEIEYAGKGSNPTVHVAPDGSVVHELYRPGETNR